MFQRNGGCGRSKTPDGSAPFEKREMPGHWKETPGVWVFCFFGGKKGKNERGMKKAGASSHIRWKKTREVQKLKRATASLQFETQLGRRWCGWICERKPLERRCQAGWFGRKA
jgi:hypothetical protein